MDYGDVNEFSFCFLSASHWSKSLTSSKQHLWLCIYLPHILFCVQRRNNVFGAIKEVSAWQKGKDEDTWRHCEYNSIKRIGWEKRQGCGVHLLAEMKVFVFFIYKMTLLVRTVGGSKLAPYDSNCSKSLCVCVSVRVHAHVRGVQWCLRERTSDRATRPTAVNRGEVEELRIAEGRCQRGDITLHVTPTQQLTTG